MAKKEFMVRQTPNPPKQFPIERNVWHWTSRAAVSSIQVHGFSRTDAAYKNGNIRMTCIMRKFSFWICDTDQLHDNRTADHTFVFAALVVLSLYILDLKYQTSCHSLWQYSLVCVEHGQNPRTQRPVFS